MRRHPRLGYEILRGVDFLAPSLPVVRHHHERWDGAGYPDGLKGEAIPLSARIFAIADAYDAITSWRPYKTALPPAVAIERIQTSSGSHFDSACVAAFLELSPELLDEGPTAPAPVRFDA